MIDQLRTLSARFIARWLRLPRRKMSIKETANLMGHENIVTTTIYTQPTEADLEKPVTKP